MLYRLVFFFNMDTSDRLIFFLLVESFEFCKDNRRSCKLFSWNKECNFRNTVTGVFFRTSPLVLLQACGFNVAGSKYDAQKTKTCGDVLMARRLISALAQPSRQLVAASLYHDGHYLLPLLTLSVA